MLRAETGGQRFKLASRGACPSPRILNGAGPPRRATRAVFRFMPRIPFQLKALGVTAAIFFFWWLGPAVIQSFTRASFFEFQAPALAGASHLRDLREYWGTRARSKDDLIRAGIDLARLNAAYEVRNQQFEALRREIEGLEALLGMPPQTEFREEVARVVRRDFNTWWHRLTIRKGRVHGIEVGNAVIYRHGVVGRIVEVNAYASVVELASSPSFRVAAHFEGDPRPVQYQGRLHSVFTTPRGVVSNVPADIEADLRNPRRLVSSRLGGAFPDGITIGTVFRLEQSPDGLFQSGTVRLSEQLLSLREVTVLVPYRPENDAAGR